MKCPCCLGTDTLLTVPTFVPGCLFPLRLFVECVHCDSCLAFFYRVRLVGWMMRSVGPNPGSDLF